MAQAVLVHGAAPHTLLSMAGHSTTELCRLISMCMSGRVLIGYLGWGTEIRPAYSASQPKVWLGKADRLRFDFPLFPPGWAGHWKSKIRKSENPKPVSADWHSPCFAPSHMCLLCFIASFLPTIFSSYPRRHADCITKNRLCGGQPRGVWFYYFASPSSI